MTAKRSARALVGAATVMGVLLPAALLGASAPPAAAATGHQLSANIGAPHQDPPAAVPSNHPGVAVKAAPVAADIPALTTASKTFVVNTLTDSPIQTGSSTTCIDVASSTPATECSLRAAVQAANNDTNHVNVIDLSLAGTYNLKSTLGTIIVMTNLQIVGSGASHIVISGQNAIRPLQLDENSTLSTTRTALSISGVTIEDGNASGAAATTRPTRGGDLYSYGALTLIGDTFMGGVASDEGGDVYATYTGTLWAQTCTFSSGTAGRDGGGVFATGPSTIEHSTFSTDQATTGGGALFTTQSAVSIGNTFTSDSADEGGAVFDDEGMIDTSSTYTNDSATGSTAEGGAFENDDSGSLTNDVFSTTTVDATDNEWGAVIYSAGALSLTGVTVAHTTSSCTSCDIDGGVIYAASSGNPPSSTLTVNGLSVTGTNNGGAGSDANIEGGVIASDQNTPVNVTGLVVAGTTNQTTGAVYGGVVYGPNSNAVDVTGGTLTGTVNEPGTADLGTQVIGGVVDISQGDLSNLSIAATTDSSDGTTSDKAVDGGVVYLRSGSISNVDIGGTTVTEAIRALTGGVLTTGEESTMDGVTITTTSITTGSATSATRDALYGGVLYETGEATATRVQILGTTVHAVQNVVGGLVYGDAYGWTIQDSTFSDATVTSSAGSVLGAAWNSYTAAGLTNVTIDGIDAVAATGHAAAIVLVTYTTTQFTDDTIAHDSVAAAAGTLTTAQSGGLVLALTHNDNLTVHLKNTIVNTTPSTMACNLDTENHPRHIVSAGGNIDDGSSCGFSQPTDQSTTTPMVGPVANNGGPVQTAALLSGSPAVGHGVVGGPATDARGVTRPAGHVDVGAYQSGPGYYEVASDGGIFAFTAPFHGSEGAAHLNQPIVGMAVGSGGRGYYEVARDGGVFAFTAPFYGSLPERTTPASDIVGIAVDPSGGYWVAGANGAVYALTAPFEGSLTALGISVNDIVAIAADPSGGYWLVSATGGVFAFGGASYATSLPGKGVHVSDIVGMAATPSGNGYWLVGKDGGVFAFGDAGYSGSMGGIPLNQPIVGMAADGSGSYWLFASDGGVFAFGGAPFDGSMGGTPLNKPVVAGTAA